MRAAPPAMRRVAPACLRPLCRSGFTWAAEDAQLHALGEAWLGNAGLPEDMHAAQPAVVPLLAGRGCRSVDVGWGHAAVVTTDGHAVLLGRPHDFRNTLRHINTRGQIPALQRLMQRIGALLFKVDAAPETLPPPGEGDGVWAEASCSTAAATALLTTTGALYTVGHNYYGQAGAGMGYAVGELPIAYAPVRVVGFDSGDPVAQVSVGFEHMLAVTASGGLYAWGRGDRGQLGLGDTEAYKSAVRVLGPGDVFLPPLPAAEEGGDGAAGGGGGGAAAAAAVTPPPPPLQPPHSRVVLCESGVSQSACVTADGRLWVWGKMQSTRVKPGTSGRHAAHEDDVLAAEPTATAAAAGRAERSTRAAAAAAAEDVLTSPGPATAVGVMEDALVPRPVFFGDELLLGEGGGGEGGAPAAAPAAAAAGADSHREPLAHDTLFRRGVVMGVGLGGQPPSAPAAAPPAGGEAAPPPSPHHPHRRVVGLTSGHAHTSFVTDDGRLWMVGMRGRGRLFDDSAAVALAAAAAAPDAADAAAAAAPCLSPRSPWYGDIPAPPPAPGDGGDAAGAAGRRLPLAADVPVPELTVQLRPWEVPLGPLRGANVVRLRSSVHHSYAITDDGRVFRWGWKGVVLPVAETAGLRVGDVQFGYAHALLLAAPEGAGREGGGQQLQ